MNTIRVPSLLLQHIYSGDVAFTAAFLIVVIAAADLGGHLGKRWAAPMARITFLIALVLGTLSGTPVMLWLLVPLLSSLVLYAIFLVFDLESRYRRWSAVAVIALTAVAVLAELPFRLSTPREVSSYARLIVAGDSLASGGFEEKRRWVDLLDDRGTAEVVDRSRPSQDVTGAASDMLELERASGTAMLLLIGGNDMIAGRSSTEFGEGLEQIVRIALARGYHPIFLVELPVLPGHWGYAAQQRRIAREHGLILIPRRVLASVLSEQRNTSDGIHLTQRGHDRMAEVLAGWLGLE